MYGYTEVSINGISEKVVNQMVFIILCTRIDQSMLIPSEASKVRPKLLLRSIFDDL